MSGIIGSAVGTVLATKLPFDNATNITIGMMSGQLITITIEKFGKVGGWIWGLIGRSRNTIKIYANEGGRYNPIYKKMEEYILDKYTKRLVQCNLAPVKGEVSIGLREALFIKPIEVTFKHGTQVHKLWLCLSKEETSVNISDKSGNNKNAKSYENTKNAKTIVVYSNTATVKVLKIFVTDIVKLEKKQSNMLTVYRAVGLKKNQTPHWDALRFKSNKTIENTILQKQTEYELFKDVDWFMHNEKWYADKGIDYKRGYLLYGPAGTGKTSSIKTIANKYNLPIFNIDLESIKTNNQLISVANDILYEAPDRSYIMAIEDFDRHEMFTNKWNYTNRHEKVTMQCLLNVIDGVVETHGRILIITCNDKTNIENTKALVRPGRIDRMVEISYLNGDQTSRLINNYFDTDLSISDDNIEDDVTPAQLIKKMQTSQSLKSTLFYICKDSNKVEQQFDLKSDDHHLEQETGPPKMDKPVPFQDNLKPTKRRARRRRNPGKTMADKKAYTIKKKEQQIVYIEKQKQRDELKKRKLEIELEYDKKKYDELKKAQDKRDELAKEKERKRKQREREQAKKKRKQLPQSTSKKRKVVIKTQNAKHAKQTKKVNVVHATQLTSQLTSYVTRSGRTIVPVKR